MNSETESLIMDFIEICRHTITNLIDILPFAVVYNPEAVLYGNKWSLRGGKADLKK